MEVHACDPALRETEAGKHELEANMDSQASHSRVRSFLKGEDIINLPVSREAKRKKGEKRKKERNKRKKQVGELPMYPAGQQLNTVKFYYC